MAKDDDILIDAKEAFKEAVDAERDNRAMALADLRFAKLEEQWDETVAKIRQEQGKPMLTINRLPSFINQVVNDARQNKPSIKTHPVDSTADPETAELFNGIIRHIEYNSSADIAYDTAIDAAVTGGFGYWRIGLEHAHDDTFDMELSINAVPDPMSVYGDPWATSYDGSDWNSAFVVERMSLKRFEKLYPDADQARWDDDDGSVSEWHGPDWAQVAEYWTREEAEREIMRLSDGSVIDVARLDEEEFLQDLYTRGVMPAEATTRKVPTWKVKQCIITDLEVLEKRDWPGKYIPIVPVYGDVINEEGKRHFRSLIHRAIDAQRMFNYWRSEETYLLALAPKAPYLGRKGTFASDAQRWATVNTEAHGYLEYDNDKPERQQLDVTALGAIRAAANSQDDMKSVMGLFDAALGARSNETSGKAILARQRESDTATFHFIDNLTRSIRHSGRILIDLIPHVWPDERVVRLMGEDGQVSTQKVNAPTPVMDKQGQPVMEPDPSQIPMPGQQPPMRPKMQTFSLTAGKYDLAATAGPSYTTKRQEAAEQMMQLLQAYPMAAPLIGDLLVKNLDWPGADEIAERLKALIPGQQGLPPEVQKMVQEGQQLIQKLQMENQQLKADTSVKQAEVQVKQQEVMIKRMEALIAKFEAETERQKVQAETGLDAARLKLDASRPPPSAGALRA